ncbi:CHD3-type chromatin-remodeling factor PICKLE isoform B [Micractinium conductrix]|uniref:CHD3-type chromatin-remodeling factor PICKLE isoform B n=1 Tax=Micractinium conductrix TaxID=554055 RepID=A0A2P6VJB3_9CHLO|nr:CHD3-type chromatin-remodeling factor PICKLE isoform B [Micractinium conductrix]|eukprot:PSC74179.1 CHD3-type chromatin-remodeling factor PICKLE isoform B [Micractinium conductrix]
MWAAAAAAAAAVAARRGSCTSGGHWRGLPAVGRRLVHTHMHDDPMETLLNEYHVGRTPQVVPFDLTEAAARDRFLAWQRGTARLAPGGLLPAGGPWRVRAALLPFWLFDVRARVDYAGSVGIEDKPGEVQWREISWHELPERQYSWERDPALQVYASYKYRRDYARMMHGPWVAKRLEPLPEADAERGSWGGPILAGGWQGGDLDPPAVRQAIAWEFVLRDLREAEHRSAELRLLQAHSAQRTRDVHVGFQVLEHSARLAFFPAFHLEYAYGETFNVHGERVPARFEALVSGAAEGGVAGTLHVSAGKAGGGLALAAMGATAAAAPLLGLDPWSLINIETAFAIATASSLAGLGARMMPVWMHQVSEHDRLRASDAEFERVVDFGLGPQDIGTEEQEFVRSAAEWRRWEAAGSEAWREHKRHLWAEELWESQRRRRLEREQLRLRLEAAKLRQEEDERRETRRRQRWGSSHYERHWQASLEGFAGGRSGGGRRDYLHYYSALGLEAAHASGHVTQEDIKHAFRRAALRWHPDKQDKVDDAGQRAARERGSQWQRLRQWQWQRQHQRHIAVRFKKKEHEGSAEERGRGEAAGGRFREPGSGGKDEAQRTAGEPTPGGGGVGGVGHEQAAAAPPPPSKPTAASQGSEPAESGALFEALGKLLDTKLDPLKKQVAAVETKVAGVETQVAKLDQLSKQVAAVARSMGATAESQARASFVYHGQPGYWAGCQITNADGLHSIASCDGWPAERGRVEEAVLDGHRGYFKARRLVLRKLKEQVPAVASLASQFGKGSGPAFWQAEQRRWTEVIAFLGLQPDRLGKGARWWSSFVSTFQAYSNAAATADDDPASNARLCSFLLAPRRTPCAPIVMLVVALAAGELRHEVDIDGAPRLTVQGGVASVEVMEARASQAGLSKARRQLRVAGKVIVWLLHVANPALLQATQPNRVEVRGKVAIQGRLTAEQRQKLEEDVEVGCPGLAATMRVEIWKSDDEDSEERNFLASSDEQSDSSRGSAGGRYRDVSSSSDEEEREWNAYCEACGGFDDLVSSLLCGTCPHQYHPACLEAAQRAPPPASAAGAGRFARGTRWTCPACRRRTQLGTQIDKVLAARGGGAAREYHLKWLHRSYLHTEWVRLSELEEAAASYPGLRRRLSTFDAKQRKHAGQQAEVVVGPDGVKPEWREVERVVAERRVGGLGGDDGGDGQGGDGGDGDGGGGARRQFLCKWRDLTYVDCTWEEEAVLGEYAAPIEQYRQRAPISEVDLQTPSPPPELDGVDHGARLPAAAAAATSADGAAPTSAGGDAGMAEDEDAAFDPLAQLAELAGAGLGASQGPLPTQRRFPSSPAFLRGQLHPYQLEGLNWLYQGWQTRTNLILADEMGLGKTVQAISYLTALTLEHRDLPHIVVVPLSTMPNWQREFARFAPQLNVVALSGNAEARGLIKEYEFFGHGMGEPGGTINAIGRRRQMLQRAVKFHVLLTSYEMAAAEEADLAKLEWQSLVVDEGHRLKNKEARLFQSLKALRTAHRVLLTGTPLQNDLSELFMLLHFLEPQLFDNLESFEAEFTDLGHEAQVERLHTLLRPHLLRRMKADVLRQLPPKREQIVAVELSAMQKQRYRWILEASYESLTKGSVGKLKNVMMELRKTVQHIYLREFPIEPRPTGPAWLQLLLDGSGKLSLLDRMLQKLRTSGHRVLIYSQFLLMLDVLEWYCATRNYSYLRLDGQVATAERQRRIDAYNSDPDRFFIFLLSTRAGGLGINLATADTVILYDSDWNPHNDLQAQARAHRLGQQSGVMVYRLIARNTVEERMMQRAKSKMVLEHVVVRKLKRSGSTASTDPVDGNELQDLIRFGAAELFADEGAEAPAAAEPADAQLAGGKARTQLPTTVAERQAGRTGGQDGRTVVWKDEAIDELLDRSKLAYGDDDAGEGGGGGDIMSGFKVAHFQLADAPAEAAAPAAAGPEGAFDGTADGGLGADDGGAMCGQEGGGLGMAAIDPAAFWRALLEGRHAAEKAAAVDALGKGKRQRTHPQNNLEQEAALDALLAGDASSDDGSQSVRSASGRSTGGDGSPRGGRSSGVSDEEYKIGSDEEQEQRAEEEQEAAEWAQAGLVGEEKERRRRRAAEELAATAAELAQEGHKKRHRRTKAEMALDRGQYELCVRLCSVGEGSLRPLGGWPKVLGGGGAARVWGFTAMQRECFAQLVMLFGVHSAADGAFDWSTMQSIFSTKRPEDVAKYGEMLMGALAAATASGSGAAPAKFDGVPLDALLCGIPAPDMLQRVGLLHLLAASLEELEQGMARQPEGKPPPATRNLARPALRSRCGSWTPFSDVRLLQGVLKHGYGRWEEVLADKDLSLETPVLGELAHLGFDSAAPKKPPSGASKEQTRAYNVAVRRQEQWLQGRLERLTEALATPPDDPDPPLLRVPIRFDFYGANVGRSLPRERAAEQQEQAQQQRAPPAAQHAADGQQQQQQQQRQPKQHGSSRGRSSSGVDHVAAAIEALQGVGEESRHRRLHVYRLNQNLQRLSDTIDTETAAVHEALTQQRQVDLVAAGSHFQNNLQGISDCSSRMLRLLEAELAAMDLQGEQQPQRAQAQQQHAQQEQAQQQHAQQEQAQQQHAQQQQLLQRQVQAQRAQQQQLLQRQVQAQRAQQQQNVLQRQAQPMQTQAQHAQARQVQARQQAQPPPQKPSQLQQQKRGGMTLVELEALRHGNTPAQHHYMKQQQQQQQQQQQLQRQQVQQPQAAPAGPPLPHASQQQQPLPLLHAPQQEPVAGQGLAAPAPAQPATAPASVLPPLSVTEQESADALLAEILADMPAQYTTSPQRAQQHALLGGVEVAQHQPAGYGGGSGGPRGQLPQAMLAEAEQLLSSILADEPAEEPEVRVEVRPAAGAAAAAPSVAAGPAAADAAGAAAAAAAGDGPQPMALG